MIECLPCLLVFCIFSYGLCDVGLMIYSFVESRNMRDFLYWRKEFYVSWVMIYISLVMLSQSNKWIGEDYECVYMKMGMGKRKMRSNRRETWDSLNLPPWISTSYTISLYCFFVRSLQIVFLCNGKFGELSLYVGRLC